VDEAGGLAEGQVVLLVERAEGLVLRRRDPLLPRAEQDERALGVGAEGLAALQDEERA
jgi:hypothetical protein